MRTRYRGRTRMGSWASPCCNTSAIVLPRPMYMHQVQLTKRRYSGHRARGSKDGEITAAAAAAAAVVAETDRWSWPLAGQLPMLPPCLAGWLASNSSSSGKRPASARKRRGMLQVGCVGLCLTCGGRSRPRDPPTFQGNFARFASRYRSFPTSWLAPRHVQTQRFERNPTFLVTGDTPAGPVAPGHCPGGVLQGLHHALPPPCCSHPWLVAACSCCCSFCSRAARALTHGSRRAFLLLPLI